MKFKFLTKNIFCAAALCLAFALFSCTNEVSGDNVVGETYVFPDAKGISGLKASEVYNGQGNKKFTFTTFFLDGWEDIPFLRIDDVSKLIALINERGYEWKKTASDGVYVYKYYQATAGSKYPAEWKNDALYFDTNAQTIYSDDFTRIISSTQNVNNNIGTVFCDWGSASAKNPSISESVKTKYVEKYPKKQTKIDLGKYGLKMFVFDTTEIFKRDDVQILFPGYEGYSDDLFIPFQVIADTFLRCADCSFNGTDYYVAIDTNSDNYATNKAYDSGRNPCSIRSQLKAEYNYRNLCLLFDMNYCLKEQRTAQYKDNIGEFINDSIFANGLGFGLLSTDTATYDTYLYKFLIGYIDDGHTMYSEPSMYQSLASVRQYRRAAYNASGPRGSTLDLVRDEMTEMRKDYGGKQGVFYVKDGNVEKMAVIVFDGFVGNDPESETDLERLADLNTYAFFKKAFEDIGSVENVVIDLSCNGGGLIQQCFLSLCFLENPTDFYLAEKNHLDNTVTKFYCEVGEVLKQTGKHFYVLTSGFSFSCGNFFPSVCKYQLKVPIVGHQSGGGGGVVKPSQTSDGALFNTSASAEMCALDKNDNYICIDAGVEVDHEIPYEKFYSGAKIYQDLYGLLKGWYPDNF